MVTNHNIVQLLLDNVEAVPSPPSLSRAQPFVKWAGGKRKLIGKILDATPKSFERYLEPFVGGGALALAFNHQRMLLNDANTELINAYRIIQNDLDALLDKLDEHKKEHSEKYFYEIRSQDPTTLNPVEQAARFIYLNKTCFNGLYRVNHRGEFNVPFGKHKNPVLYELNNLKAVSIVLRNAELFAEDYQHFLKHHAQPGDFIYLDPPYNPISQYSDFKRYTKEQFREHDQHALAQVYNDLIALGAYPVLSNSYSELTLDLYKQHEIQIIYAGRNINHEGTGRKPVREILVKPRH